MAGIPTVKLWRIRFECGAVCTITAPTKLLARLNVRHDLGDYRAIDTVGLLRRPNWRR